MELELPEFEFELPEFEFELPEFELPEFEFATVVAPAFAATLLCGSFTSSESADCATPPKAANAATEASVVMVMRFMARPFLNCRYPM